MNAKKTSKKDISILICLAALLALAIFFTLPYLAKNAPSKEPADLNEYFGLSIAYPDMGAILLNDNYIDAQARLISGTWYIDIDTARKYIGETFYASIADRILLVTTADEVVKASDGELSYIRHAEEFGSASPAPETLQTDYAPYQILAGTSYVALDFLENFANLSWKAYTSPYRVKIETQWTERQIAGCKSAATLRTKANSQSPILKTLERAEKVIVLKRGENWSRVKTADAFIGYVENRRLSDAITEAANPITAYEAPAYTSLTSDEKICLVWNQVSVMDANAFLFDLLEEKGAEPVNVVSPTWFSINSETGTFDSRASRDYVDQCHARGLEVWALIDDFLSGLNRHELLSREANRHRLIAGLMSAAETYALDGINLDFEVVPVADALHFEEFIRELSVACRQAGLVFSIDNYVPRERTAHYNRKLQGEIADYVIIMGYDEHYDSHVGIGSVASLPFVEDGIVRTLAEVPANKVINAVPFYTRIWTTYKDGSTGSSAVGQTTQGEWLEKHEEAIPEWDEETSQNYVEYEKNGTLQQIWLEDAASQRARTEMMAKYSLAGIAVWRLGFGKPETWSVISEYLEKD